MKKFSKIISLLLALIMVLTMVPGSALAVVSAEGQGNTDSYTGTLGDRNEASAGSVTATKIDNPGIDLKNNQTETEKLERESYADTDMVDVIVVMDDKPLLKYGYSTSEIATNGASVSRRIASLREKQEDLVARINKVVANGASTFAVQGQTPEVTVTYYYNVILSGVAIQVPYGALEEIKALKGVEDAFVAPVFSVPEDMSADSDNAAQPNMYATQNGFGSALTWEELGYTGTGMRIAILDTGLDTDHPSFAADPQLNENSLTLEEVAEVLPELNAAIWYEYEHGEALTAEDVYRSAKIPFAYNYGFNTLNVEHDDLANDHGTHVAGTAAANKMEGSDVVGVAPDAQIIALKVFNSGGGASSIDIIAAMEDAFRLNVDVMNLSLGSDAGFTQMNELFNTILDSDMIVSISAGNSYSAAYGNGYGTNTNLTSDPDNGLVGWPATMIGATAVASIENDYFMTNYVTINDQVVAYADANIYTDLDFTYIAGEYEYVMIPGYGAAEDYASVDVAGKIAVVSRGELAFTDKETNAAMAGAVACIIYDNVEGGLIYMQSAGLIPSVFISKADSEIFANAAVDGVGTVTIKPADDLVAATSPQAGIMSSFSSWGAAPDLRLVPSVTAPGGNIYSSVDPAVSGMGSYYATMSGTSMSAPHIAGMSALVLQYLREKYDLTDAQAHTIAEALIMSTATPVLESTGVPYSPRKQGAGLANVYNAIASSSYLTVNGNPGGQPSVSMGDDADKTGVYNFEFTINNLSGEDQVYALDASVLTDYVDLSYASIGYYFMGETSLPLDADVTFSLVDDSSAITYDLDGNLSFDLNDVQYLLDYVNGVSGKTLSNPDHFDLNEDGTVDTADVVLLKGVLNNLSSSSVENVVVVSANSSATFQVEIVLTEESKAYMDYFYPNGIYVDGFVRCYSMTEDADLSLPFLGFYGDWSEAGEVFDTGWWYELYSGDYYSEYNRYPNMMWTDMGANDWLLGLNLYIDEQYDPAHNVLSPNGDGQNDMVTEIYLGMMRNALAVEFTWTDSEGNILFQRTAEGVRKSVYNYAYGICYPFVYSDYIYQVDEDGNVIWTEDGFTVADIYDLTDLENGEQITLTINAWLDDGDDIVDDSLSFPLVIDTEAPVLDEENIDYLDGKYSNTRMLEITVSDNYDIAAIIPLTLAGAPIEYIAAEGEMSEDGETYTMYLDVTDYDSSFILALSDYGANESYYLIEFEGDFDVNFDAFYGYRRYSAVPYADGYYYVTEGYNGWVSFEETDSMLNHTYMYDFGETAVNAAEYVDGYIFGIDVNGEIFVMKAGDWTRIYLGTMPEGYDANYDSMPYPALDMAYDYTSGRMFILADTLTTYDTQTLYEMDITTGDVWEVGCLPNTADNNVFLTLACDNDGILYTIALNTGDLYTIDVNNTYTEGEYWWNQVTYVTTAFVGATGYVPAYQQSMTVDHETNELYWLAYCGSVQGYAYLLNVDKATGVPTIVVPSGFDGTDFYVEYNSEVTALYKPFDCGEDIIPDADLMEIVLSAANIPMSVGNSETIAATPYPYNADLGELTWASSDETVAVVYDGTVVALGEGRAVITVTSVDTGLTAECVVDVIDVNGELVYFDMGNNYLWSSMNVKDPASATVIEGAIESFNGFTAAAYFDGWIYAGEYGGNFYRLDPETLTGTKLGTFNGNLSAMAFNYADGYMYGIVEAGSYFTGITHSLVRINLSTGETVELTELTAYDEETWENIYGTTMAMAIDYEGNFYAVSINSMTYETELMKWKVVDDAIVDLTSASLTAAGYSTSNYSSMVYSDANGGLFWANDAGQLVWIDLASYGSDDGLRAVTIGYVGEYVGYAMNMGLLEVLENEPELPEVELESVSVPNLCMVLEGGTVSVNVATAPWNAYPVISYEVADETLAVVDESGNLTGIAVGETTLTITVEGWDEPFVVPVQVRPAAGYLNGFLLNDFYSNGSGYWVGFQDTTPNNPELLQVNGEEYNWTVFSGAYFDGKIYGFAQDQGNLDYKNYLVSFDASDLSSVEMIAKINYNFRDMAVDYTTGNLYAIADGGNYVGAVALVDVRTGDVTIVAETGVTFAAMTIDAEGNMYGIGEDDVLYAIDKYTGELTAIANTGVDAGHLYQSMHYDYNTGNTYWAQVSDNQTGSLRLVDLETGTTADLGVIYVVGCEIGALYTIPGNEPTEPDMETLEVTGIEVTEKAVVAVGETVELDATVLTAVELKPAVADPYAIQTQSVNNSSLVDGIEVAVEWTSADESIATVDENGVVTGVSAGTVVITATVDGYSASCTVTVTEGDRKFYAYDVNNGQWLSFVEGDGEIVEVEVTDYYGNTSMEERFTLNTEVVYVDGENETVLSAAYYTGETLYAYDVNGQLYAIDPETFERTAIGDPLAPVTVTVEVYDYWMGGTYEVEAECTISVVDLSVDNDTLYMVGTAANADYGIECYVICTVDVETGACELVLTTTECRPGNLLVQDGRAFMVDTYTSGMLNYVDLYADAPAVVQQSLIQGYWGDQFAGRSLMMDELTGTIYAIRDKAEAEYDDDWNMYYPVGESELCVLNLGDGDIQQLGYIGEGNVLVGLFVR